MKEPLNPIYDLFLGGFWIGFGAGLVCVGLLGAFFWLLKLPLRAIAWACR